jgi:hypothetical protein
METRRSSLSKNGPPRAAGIELLERLDGSAAWKRGLIIAVVLFALVSLLMPELVFQNRIFLVPDTKAPLSFASVGREALDEGTYPLWNPYLFCGMPSFGSLAYTPFVYPPSFVTHLLHEYLHTPEMTWLLLHYILAAAGMYLLLRSFDIRPLVSLLGGAVFMMLPNYIAIGANGHGSQACAISYMPIALLLARNVMTGKRRLEMASYLAIILGFQMLRGHVQISYYTYLMIGLLFLFEIVYLLRSEKRRDALLNTLCLAGAFIAAIGIAAVLIFPVRDYAALSIRGGGEGGLDYGYATGWSLHPKEMITFFLPWSYGYGKATYWGMMPFTDYPNYLGVLTASFAALSLFIVRNRWRWFLFVTALLSTLLSFGKFFPLLYEPMFRFFPYFDKFRVPVMILIVQQLSLVALMGLGLEEYLRRYEEGKLPAFLEARRLKWILIVGAAAIVITLIAGGSIRESIVQELTASGRLQAEAARMGARAASNDLPLRILLFAAIPFVLFLASSRKMLANTVVLLLAIVAIIDLALIDQPVIRPERTWKRGDDGYRIIRGIEARDEFMRADPLISYLEKDDTYFRLFPAPAARPGQWSYSTPPFSENRFMIHRIFSLGGYHAAKMKAYQQVIDAMFSSFNRGVVPLNILNMLNAKYILSYFPLFDDGSSFPLVWNEGNAYIYENPFALERVTLVGEHRVVPREQMLQRILSRDFEPGRQLLLEEDPGFDAVSAEGSSADIVEYGLNRIVVDASIEQPCFLLLSEVFSPSWRVHVDGVETELLSADFCLRAVPLETGEHEVVFRYSSRVLNVSLFISIAVFAAAVLVPIVSRIVLAKKG